MNTLNLHVQSLVFLCGTKTDQWPQAVRQILATESEQVLGESAVLQLCVDQRGNIQHDISRALRKVAPMDRVRDKRTPEHGRNTQRTMERLGDGRNHRQRSLWVRGRALGSRLESPIRIWS